MAEMRRLENKVAIVTGGGTGIGAAIAKRFVEEGARVCIVGRRTAPLEEVARSLPAGSVATCAGDVSSESDIDRMVKTALDFQGAIHILVNNAALPSHGSVTDLDPADWRRSLDVNLTGPFLTMHRIIPLMIRAGGGSIINVASVGGLRCIPGAPAYCSPKAGLIMLTQQVAVDYGRHGIRSNVVCPGLVRTEMTDMNMDYMGQSFNLDREGTYKMAVTDQPLGRAAMPDEIAPLCAYLASSESSFMTGAVLVIDGGIAILDAGMVAMKG
jgi:meso-butanediol dehydrogenase/(S,S)-butanediol dehydrogenase/diacetyl reductase